MFEKVWETVDRFEEIDKQLNDPAVAGDPQKSSALMKERGKIVKLASMGIEFRTVQNQIKDAEEMGGDPDMKEMAEEELKSLRPREEQLRKQLEEEILTTDENSARNVIMEIRPGTGGDEAALFAGDLYRMYQRFAEIKGWKFKVVELSGSDLGGIKYANFTIEGTDVYRFLHLESGTHRVQRVPKTEASGRIHTSAATVAVLPEAEEVDVDLNTKDLKIDTYSAGGPGGQHVNKSQSAVRITHLPTNIVVQCQNERSQGRNKDLALRWLRAKLYDHYLMQQRKTISDIRRTQVGTGDRSEKIRTYNFPQNRITDHRIKFSVHNLPQFLDGSMDEMIAKLLEEERNKKLAALTNRK